MDEYFLDLRNFFRYLKIERGLVPRKTELEDISIMDVDLAFVGALTMSEVYDYLAYLARNRAADPQSRTPRYGLTAASRARKVATIRSFYRYLTVKTKQLSTNPVADLDSPKIQKSLPRYLTLEEAERLLSSVDGVNKERDYCMLTLFLNCGLRISEVVGLNFSDVRGDALRVLGKGGKERIVYLNDACVQAVDDYLPVRGQLAGASCPALFVSARRGRLSSDAVQAMVRKTLLRAGLDADKYSPHKLRHTAATLMLQNGVDIRTLQEVLGHKNLNTTEIYTHVDNAELHIAAQANPLGHFKPPAATSDEPDKPSGR